MSLSRVRSLRAPWAGIVALSGGLLGGDFAAQLVGNWNSPVTSIGNRIINHVPSGVKSWVITVFGGNDKKFLIVVITAAVLVIGMYIGKMFINGGVTTSYAIIGALAVIGSIASVFDEQANFFSILPSLISAGVSVALLKWLGRESSVKTEGSVEISRRDVFKVSSVVASMAVVSTITGRYLKERTKIQLDRISVSLPKPAKSLKATDLIDPADSVPGLSKLYTPNAEFFRIDTAIQVPHILTSEWSLKIDGLVENPFEISYDQLISRPTFELDNTISCVSNEVGGPLVGNARWLGVRLDDLIAEARPLARADQIMSYSKDGFSAGFPTAVLDGRDAMIAIAMNGEALPLEHGFPARIIVPGLYGYVSATKWLTHIELTRFDKKQGYWVPRGWAALAPIKMQSRIDTPTDFSDLSPGKMAIAGVAWAPLEGIEKVEVRIDKGVWVSAVLGPEIANTTWRQWWIDWDAPVGKHEISVRAVNKKGVTQTSVPASVDPDGAQGWHTINVESA